MNIFQEQAKIEGHLKNQPQGAEEKILFELANRLSPRRFFQGSTLDAEFSNGELVLSGHVDSYKQKFLAEDIAAEIPGVTRIQNYIQVAPLEPAEPLQIRT